MQRLCFGIIQDCHYCKTQYFITHIYFQEWTSVRLLFSKHGNANLRRIKFSQFLQHISIFEVQAECGSVVLSAGVFILTKTPVRYRDREIIALHRIV